MHLDQNVSQVYQACVFEIPEYFPRLGDLNDILRPFGATGQEATKYDISVLVNGGGTTGQTEAVRLGVARALVLINVDFTSALRKKGLLTRDARVNKCAAGMLGSSSSSNRGFIRWIKSVVNLCRSGSPSLNESATSDMNWTKFCCPSPAPR